MGCSGELSSSSSAGRYGSALGSSGGLGGGSRDPLSPRFAPQAPPRLVHPHPIDLSLLPVPTVVAAPRVGPARLIGALAHALVRLSPQTCGEYDAVLKAATSVANADEGVARYLTSRLLDSWPRSDAEKEKACLSLISNALPLWISGEERPGGSVLDVDGEECGVLPEPHEHLIKRVVARMALCVRSKHTAVANEAVMQCLPRSMASSKGQAKASLFGAYLLADPAALLAIARALELNAGVQRPIIHFVPTGGAGGSAASPVTGPSAAVAGAGAGDGTGCDEPLAQEEPTVHGPGGDLARGSSNSVLGHGDHTGSASALAHALPHPHPHAHDAHAHARRSASASVPKHHGDHAHAHGGRSGASGIRRRSVSGPVPSVGPDSTGTGTGVVTFADFASGHRNATADEGDASASVPGGGAAPHRRRGGASESDHEASSHGNSLSDEDEQEEADRTSTGTDTDDDDSDAVSIAAAEDLGLRDGTGGCTGTGSPASRPSIRRPDALQPTALDLDAVTGTGTGSGLVRKQTGLGTSHSSSEPSPATGNAVSAVSYGTGIGFGDAAMRDLVCHDIPRTRSVFLVRPSSGTAIDSRSVSGGEKIARAAEGSPEWADAGAGAEANGEVEGEGARFRLTSSAGGKPLLAFEPADLKVPVSVAGFPCSQPADEDSPPAMPDTVQAFAPFTQAASTSGAAPVAASALVSFSPSPNKASAGSDRFSSTRQTAAFLRRSAQRQELQRLIAASFALTDGVIMAIEAHERDNAPSSRPGSAHTYTQAGYTSAGGMGRAGGGGGTFRRGSGAGMGTTTGSMRSLPHTESFRSLPIALHSQDFLQTAAERAQASVGQDKPIHSVRRSSITGITVSTSRVKSAISVVTPFIAPSQATGCYGMDGASIKLPAPPVKGPSSSSGRDSAGGSAGSGGSAYRGSGHWSHTVRYNSMVVLQQLDKALKDKLTALQASLISRAATARGAAAGGVHSGGHRGASSHHAQSSSAPSVMRHASANAVGGSPVPPYGGLYPSTPTLQGASPSAERRRVNLLRSPLDADAWSTHDSDSAEGTPAAGRTGAALPPTPLDVRRMTRRLLRRREQQHGRLQQRIDRGQEPIAAMLGMSSDRHRSRSRRHRQRRRARKAARLQAQQESAAAAAGGGALLSTGSSSARPGVAVSDYATPVPLPAASPRAGDVNIHQVETPPVLQGQLASRAQVEPFDASGLATMRRHTPLPLPLPVAVAVAIGGSSMAAAGSSPGRSGMGGGSGLSASPGLAHLAARMSPSHAAGVGGGGGGHARQCTVSPLSRVPSIGQFPIAPSSPGRSGAAAIDRQLHGQQQSQPCGDSASPSMEHMAAYQAIGERSSVSPSPSSTAHGLVRPLPVATVVAAGASSGSYHSGPTHGSGRPHSARAARAAEALQRALQLAGSPDAPSDVPHTF